MNTLPKPREARQLCRLRSLRVQRARERCNEARAAVDTATAAVHQRQRQIERWQQAVTDLGEAIVHGLAPHLPRLSGMVAAQREHLMDRLEREEYALIDDEQHLEETQEKAQQARAELTRALAREDAVAGLARQTLQAQAKAREQRAERDLEDEGRAAARAA